MYIPDSLTSRNLPHLPHLPPSLSLSHPVFGASKLCKYNGQYYCFDCHIDDERVIPSRVLFNWDFRRHRVCRASCEFLDSIAESAVLNIEETNPALYMYIPELEEALVRIKIFLPSQIFLLYRENFEGGSFVAFYKIFRLTSKFMATI